MSDKGDQVEDRLKTVVGSLLTKLDEKESHIADLKRQVTEKSLGVSVAPQYIDSIESKRSEAKNLSSRLSEVEKRLIQALQTITLKYNEALASFDAERARLMSHEKQLKSQMTASSFDDAANKQRDKIADLEAEIASLKGQNSKLSIRVESSKSSIGNDSLANQPKRSGRRPPVYFVPLKPDGDIDVDIEDHGILSTWLTGMFGSEDPDPMEKALLKINALQKRNKDLEASINVALQELKFWREFPDAGGVNMRMEEMWRRAVGAILMRNDLDVMKAAFLGWRDVTKSKRDS